MELVYLLVHPNQITLFRTVVLVVELLSCVRLFATLWTVACQASLSFTFSWSLLRLNSIESVMPSNCLILCHHLLLLPSVFPASGSFPVSCLFTSGGQSIGASASALNPSNENSGFIFFRIDWFDLLAVQGTLKSLLQHHNSKSSCQWILIHSSKRSKEDLLYI